MPSGSQASPHAGVVRLVARPAFGLGPARRQIGVAEEVTGGFLSVDQLGPAAADAHHDLRLTGPKGSSEPVDDACSQGTGAQYRRVQPEDRELGAPEPGGEGAGRDNQ